jgi:hypothetical protein
MKNLKLLNGRRRNALFISVLNTVNVIAKAIRKSYKHSEVQSTGDQTVHSGPECSFQILLMVQAHQLTFT